MGHFSPNKAKTRVREYDAMRMGMGTGPACQRVICTGTSTGTGMGAGTSLQPNSIDTKILTAD